MCYQPLPRTNYRLIDRKPFSGFCWSCSHARYLRRGAAGKRSRNTEYFNCRTAKCSHGPLRNHCRRPHFRGVCAWPHTWRSECGRKVRVDARRVATDLVALGYTQVRRYQLGIPVWRALGGVTEVELAGIHYVLARDQTAVFIDTRNAERFNEGTLANARNIQARYVESGSDARHVAEALARNAFHNVSFFDGTYSEISTNSAGLSQ